MTWSDRIRGGLVALVAKGESLLETGKYDSDWYTTYVDSRLQVEWSSQAITRLIQFFGSDHTYTERFRSEVSGTEDYRIRRGLGVLQAALDDVEQGYLEPIKELAVAEVFSDLLDQADHLLENKYSTPAASLAGAVLENGLRSLATRKAITVRASDNLQSLNTKIADKGVYNRLRQKQVAVWIDVRNAADHGRFGDFTDEDVADLIKGVRSLLSSVA